MRDGDSVLLGDLAARAHQLRAGLAPVRSASLVAELRLVLAVAAGLEDVAAGRLHDVDDVEAWLEARWRQRAL